MKRIKESKLFFKEGNSDKVYEVDLSEVGPDQYTVNFRYGRRGSPLKEGSKTATPVSLAAAQVLFDSLELEKRKKGYQSESEMFQPLPTVATNTDAPPATRQEAILRRISALANGQTEFKTAWKPSRVFWRAGVLRITEAAPFLIRLVDRGDDMQRYAVLWALGRMADPQATRTLQICATNGKYSDKIRRIASEGLLHVLTGPDRHEFLQTLLAKLPDEPRQALFDNKPDALTTLLRESVLDTSATEYPILETLYALAIDYPAARPALITILREIPLKPGTFRHVRHLLKAAELRDDFEVMGLLAYRFERGSPFFNNPRYYWYDDSDDKKDPSVYVAAIAQKLKIRAELRKPDSRLAYSDRTRDYLKRRMSRALQSLGKDQNTGYVRLATAILVSYENQTDYREPYEVREWQWVQNTNGRGGNYITISRQFPAYADAMLMNRILYGNSTRLEPLATRWRFRQEATTPVIPTPAETAPGSVFGSFFTRIGNLLNRNPAPADITTSQPDKSEITAPSSIVVHEESYPELWDQMPQAYVTLLMRARVDAIHQFAYQNLRLHPDYTTLANRMAIPLIRQLLESAFEIPARWAVELIRDRPSANTDPELIRLLIQSTFADARKLGLQWLGQQWPTFGSDSSLIQELVFSPFSDVRDWIDGQLSLHPLTSEQQQLLIGRTVAALQLSTTNDPETNELIRSATNVLLRHTAGALPTLSQTVVSELLAIPVEATQAFAVRLLILKNAQPTSAVLSALLTSPYADVRQAGEDLFAGIHPNLSPDSDYGKELVHNLIPALIRKELYEGQHEAIGNLIQRQMQPYLSAVDKTTALRLIYAHFRPAQETGLLVLRNHIPAESLTMRQIVALGNHELLAVRHYAGQIVQQNPARTRYELTEAIGLLDANWADTREMAMTLFRQLCDENDWTPETLVGLADSVRPDIQAFGRELISRFFTDEHGPEYLLKLSQHPTADMQLFATNYLQQYATDQPERLRALAFYFRSVLARVGRGRIAKIRVFVLLEQESVKSYDNALFVSQLLTDISATAAIGDKATCIQILNRIRAAFPELPSPLTLHSNLTEHDSQLQIQW